MAIEKLIKTIRTNPIKSSLAAIASGCGLWWYSDYVIASDYMRGRSKDAAKKGDMKLKSALYPVKHITVIINPVAGKRKSRQLYAKWVEPLFHLAGFKVSVVQTDSPGQATEIMRVMSNCDCVAIVGGDGTVREAINGLVSRPDSASLINKLPIAIIPTGKINNIAHCLHQDLNQKTQKQFLIDTAMTVVEGNTRYFDVTVFLEQFETYALRLLAK